MALIEFKNKPDKNTPLNADNLNHNFNELNSNLEEINNKIAKEYIAATANSNISVSGNTDILLTATKQSGTKLILENNKIKIGAGVSKVQVSGSVFIEITTQNNGYLWGRIVKNSTHVSGSIVPLLSGNAFVSSSIPSIIINVTEGDLLYLNVDAANIKGTVRTGDANTWLYVEVIE